MSKSNALENDLLEKIFKATAISWDAITDLRISLHTADPGEGGDQTTNECAYGGYGRVLVARSGSGFTVSGANVVNAAEITFPQCTSGSETITHVGVGTATSGTGRLLYSFPLTANLAVSSGITPRFVAGALSITED